jgi:cytochrome c oxidase subunit 2
VRLAVVILALFAAGCSGPQSALDPAGDGAERLAGLFWVMLAGAAVLWAAVISLAVFAARTEPGRTAEAFGSSLILWGGAVVPTAVLAALLTYGLLLMPDLRGPGDGLRIAVSGEQFWWRVRYRPASGAPGVDSANEIRLPAGERVEFLLDAPDVIHSFWIPPLGGKLDMIPGRTNRLVLHPRKPGVYRGVCAEFCGTAHALMAFSVIVMEGADFARWLDAEAREAAPTSGRGAELFLANGCGACHAVRGSEGRGRIGPDLTHIGSRRTIGAGMLDNTAENLARFIAETEQIKPGSRMPSYGMLPADDLRAIAAYLASLK